MEKQTHKNSDREHDFMGDPVETLTVYNTGQLVVFLCIGIFSLIIRTGELLTRCVRVMLAVCASAIRFVLRGMGSALCMGYRAIDTAATLIARAIAWAFVGFFWLIGMSVWMMIFGLWRSVTFVVITIPVVCVHRIGHILFFVFDRMVYVFDDVREHAALFPSRTYDSLQRTAASITPPAFWWKRLVAFTGILLLFALPFPAIRSYQFLTEVRADTTATALLALDTLQQGVAALQAGDAVRAQVLFSTAHDTFERARSTVSQVPTPLRSVAKVLPSVGKKISDGEALLDIGLSASKIGLRASDLSQRMADEQAFGKNFFQTLAVLFTAIDEFNPLIREIDETIAHISPEIIPDQYREQFETLNYTAGSVSALVESLSSARSVFLTSLGAEQKRRYLLLFQNNAELRPTGGFLGSYALIDVYQGKLVNIEIPGGGSYDMQGQLTEFVRSPQPLHLVNPRWEFQDSNWFPDFPTSAQKILWFYERAGGPTVDGVLAVNAEFFERLLSVIGSIEMPGYRKELTSENFFIETHKAVELEYDKEKNKPKQFIADLFPAALGKMGSSSDAYVPIAGLFIDALARRDIQVFLRNSAEQDQIARFGISGVVRDAARDYLMVVSANVGGGKTDAALEDSLTRKLVVRDDGSLEAHVTLSRKHNGKRGDPFMGVPNNSYLRFYFPRGTTLLAASGFRSPPLAQFEFAPAELREDSLLRMIEGTPAIDPTTGMIVTHEFNKSVFAHWLVLKPGEEETVSLSVLLPFTIKDLPERRGERMYSLLIQRQSGSRITSVTLEQGAESKTISPFQSDIAITGILK